LAPVDAEYNECAEPQEDGDGTHGEALSEDLGQQTFGHTESEEYKEPTPADETSTDLPAEFIEPESFAPVEGEVTYPVRETQNIANKKDEGNIEDSHKLAKFVPEDRVFDVTGYNSPATVLPDLELQHAVDESDSHSVTVENNIADPLLDSSNSEQHIRDVAITNPEPFDEEWDDSLDGEGEPDINWEGEHDDIVSNESSITLSSSASKRRYDEVDSEWEHASVPASPELKRSRIE